MRYLLMKPIVIAGLLFWGLCSTTLAQTSADSGTIIRVLTFNILHGATTQGTFDLDLIARVIQESQADIVALQEVDFKTRRAKNYDLATELGWRTKMASVFGKAMDYDGGAYGEAILSKHSFAGSRLVNLPHSPDHEPRAALEVLIAFNEQDTISFIATHLDHLRDDSDRFNQTKAIVQVFNAVDYPCIIAGDLNDIPGSRSIQTMENHWTATYEPGHAAPTFPSDHPRKKIDYIMYKPQKRWRLISTEVIADSIASDHCAYMAVLELLDKP